MAKSLDRETLASVAPKLAELSIDTLFNDIWKRETLSPRERSGGPDGARARAAASLAYQLRSAEWVNP